MQEAERRGQKETPGSQPDHVIIFAAIRLMIVSSVLRVWRQVICVPSMIQKSVSCTYVGAKVGLCLVTASKESFPKEPLLVRHFD